MTDASGDSSVASSSYGWIRSLGYSAFFPLLLVVAVVAPVAVASSTPVALFEAAEYTFLAVGIGYIVGLVLLLR